MTNLAHSIETHSGARVVIPNTDPQSIIIGDIAHALSHVCRFAGHTAHHYSVAAHSMAVADLVPEEHKLQALIHDATEAYICDIPTPFKLLLPDYQQMENDLWLVIAKRFNVNPELHETVRLADRVMLMSERDILKPNSKHDWSEFYEKTHRRIDRVNYYRGITQDGIARMFMQRFKEYAGT